MLEHSQSKSQRQNSSKHVIVFLGSMATTIERIVRPISPKYIDMSQTNDNFYLKDRFTNSPINYIMKHPANERLRTVHKNMN